MNKDQFAYLNETIVELEAQLAQAREEIEGLRKAWNEQDDRHLKYEEELQAKLSKAEEEIAELNKAVNMQTDLYRAELVKNEKLERVAINMETMVTWMEQEDRYKKLKAADLVWLEGARNNLASLRETEER